MPRSYGPRRTYAHAVAFHCAQGPKFFCWEIIPAPWMGPDFLTAQKRSSSEPPNSVEG